MKTMVNTGKTGALRCVMLGDGMVGKTSLVHSFLGYTLSPSYTATVFMDNYSTHLSLAGVKHRLQITDLSIEVRTARIHTTTYIIIQTYII